MHYVVFVLRAHDLLDQLRRKAQFLQHNDVLFMFGDDFRFYQHGEWRAQFRNLSRIFDFMNRDETMHVEVGVVMCIATDCSVDNVDGWVDMLDIGNNNGSTRRSPGSMFQDQLW